MPPCSDPLAYYARPGAITDAGRYAALLAELPDDVPSLSEIVQGLVIHDIWVTRYGIPFDDTRWPELRLYTVERILARAFELDPRPLHVPRPPERRVMGCCRDFSVLLCAMLRAKGIPARARCGFAAYFTPGQCEDHWITEYWDPSEMRWVAVDAQIDALQRGVLGIGFDVCDLPRGTFLPGGRAWQMCRREGSEPRLFGIASDYRGLWFVRGNMLRDLAALNRMETVPYLVGRPWDAWPLLARSDADLMGDELTLLDRVADLSLSGDAAHDQVRALYEAYPELQPPERWLKDLQARWFG